MLTIYPLSLRIKNPKLYKSPYKVNILQVLKVIKKYDVFCRINFYKNLSTLKIEEVDEEMMSKIASSAYAAYKKDENKIYLLDNLDDISKHLNHELFHVASNRKKHYSGIVWGQYNSTKKNKAGETLNEGITEYLALKSLGERRSVSGYQLELFVVEFLCFIYGERILEYYFKNNGKDFFEQFKNTTFCYGNILQIDEKMHFMNDNESYQNFRVRYLYLSNIAPDILVDDIKYLRELELNNECLYPVARLVSCLSDKISKRIEVNKIYKIEDKDKNQVLAEYNLEYDESQRIYFKYILDKLIEMAQLNNKNINQINNFLIESLDNKDDEFKRLYTDVINEKQEYKVKKR